MKCPDRSPSHRDILCKCTRPENLRFDPNLTSILLIAELQYNGAVLRHATAENLVWGSIRATSNSSSRQLLVASRRF